MSNYNFVVCPSYHGATLLSCFLGNHSQVSSMGDTLPEKQYLEKGAATCSCGETIDACVFWKKIIEEVNPHLVYRDNNILPQYPIILDNEKYNRALAKCLGLVSLYLSHSIWKLFGTQCSEFIEQYKNYYSLVCSQHKTIHFIDGKKNLIKISVFLGMENLNSKVKVIHLMRDPRAVFYSHRKRNHLLTVEDFCKYWVAFHKRSQKLGCQLGAGRYYSLRYEKFCQFPSKTLTSLQDFLGVPWEELIKIDSNYGSKHMIGSTMLQKFNGIVKLDTNWEKSLPDPLQQKVVRLTEPFFSEIGYQSKL